jgi:Domain of unknown function (DUF4402)
VNKYTLKAALIAGTGIAASLIAAPVQAATASASSRATIYRPMTLASLLDLNFGTVVTDGTGGVVNLDVGSASRSCDPGLSCSNTFAFATLMLTGSNTTVQVNYNPIVQLTGPGTPMDVNIQFPGGPGALVTITNNATNIAFGALLTVNPNQADGDYAGNFSVDVVYP